MGYRIFIYQLITHFLHSDILFGMITTSTLWFCYNVLVFSCMGFIILHLKDIRNIAKNMVEIQIRHSELLKLEKYYNFLNLKLLFIGLFSI